MYKNVVIKSTGTYLPETVLTNDHYVEHFDKLGLKSRGLYKALGRDKRHVVSEGENTFTMGLEAANQALKNANVDVTEIDMLVFASDAPEYLAPTTALALHDALGTVNAHMVFDMNQNCTGMIAAIDVVTRYMKTTKHLKKALVVSAFNGTLMANPNEPVTHGVLSDGASSVVLELLEEETERGVIDSNYKSDPETWRLMVYPACGLSKMEDPSIPVEGKKIYWGHEEADFLPIATNVMLKQLLKNNDLQAEDVEHYIVSQFEPEIMEAVHKELNVPLEKFTSTHAELGYMGNSSPIHTYVALLNQKTVNKGEKLILSSIGSGYTMASILYQF